MLTLDAQVHAYERNHPGRPWVGTLYGPAEVTGDQMVAAMGAVGVDGAILVSPFSMYRYDANYALEVYGAHPDRFRLVKPVDPTDAAVVVTIADWASTDGTVGIRIFLRGQCHGNWGRSGATDRIASWHGPSLVSPPSLPAVDHPARDLALSPVYPELPRRGRAPR